MRAAPSCRPHSWHAAANGAHQPPAKPGPRTKHRAPSAASYDGRVLSRRAAAIAAIATAPGRGAVGIVRVSGSGLQPLVRALCGRDLVPRQATLLPFLGADGQAIDQGLALYFPAPHSYTGEDVLELQAHGGAVLLQMLLARCLEAGGESGLDVRLAQPGEFTERAFLNDKLDLAQAEAVADLIDASTEAAARSASRSLSGVFSQQVGSLRERIVRLRMLVEATLDFPEEELDFLQRGGAMAQLRDIGETLDALIGSARQGALLRDGMRVVLAGQPNVGKSSLLNALAGAELAIVTPVPGTTRDRVGQTIQIEGVPVHVTDTAGLREHSADEVERIGIARSWDSIADADSVLFLHDLTRAGQAEYEAAEAQIAARLPAAARLLHVHTKLDLIPTARGVQGGAAISADAVVLSAHTGEGLSVLRKALLQRAGWHALPDGVFLARTRHLRALERTRRHMQTAHAHAALEPAPLELLAEELRLGHEALAEITGSFSADDLLGEIFSRFCIGK